MNTDLRFPIGPFQAQAAYTAAEVDDAIAAIEKTPAWLRDAVRGLSPDQLDTPYRPEGWTVRQVVHHLPDSHMNSYVRFKLALTEDRPTIKPYQEDRWAHLADYRGAIEPSLVLLEALHRRWVELLRSLKTEDLQRTFMHPEMGEVPVATNIAIYDWHGRHHIAHITTLREREGWNAQ